MGMCAGTSLAGSCSQCKVRKMMRGLRQEQFDTLADMQRLAQERPGRCLSEAYQTSLIALDWACVEGHRWWAAPKSVKRGQWFRACANDRKRLPLADIKAAA